MKYYYQCSNCSHDYVCYIPMSEHKTPQPCPECSTENIKLFKPCTNHVFKGDGWSTKNERIKKQMRKKNEKLDARQNEMKKDAPSVTLAPNVDGERVDSWSDAQKLAKSKGKSTESYEPLIAKEKASKK
jgi:predicted nucleic acid-binding Zn ribbon protein